METRKERDLTRLLQLLGLTMLLLTLELWQVFGSNKSTFIFFLLGCLSLVASSFAAIRSGTPSVQYQRNTLLLLALEIVSGLFLYGNAKEIVAATGYHKELILAIGLVVVILVQAAQVFFTGWKPVLTKKRAVEVLLVGALCIVFGFLLNLKSINTWPVWDSYAYFRLLENISINNIFQAGESGLMVGSHVSPSFALWTLLMREIPGVTAVNAQYLSNMFLIAVDLALFYLLFRYLLPGKSVPQYALFAVTATVAPWVWGSVAGINPEHLLMTGFLLLLYAAFSGNALLSVISLFVICGARETGGVVAAAIVFMQFVCELSKCIKRREKLKSINWAYYVLCFSIGLFWLLQLLNSRWMNGERSLTNPNTLIDGSQFDLFGFSWLHIQDCLRELFLANFRWLFTVVILVAFILFLVRCIRGKEEFSSLFLLRAHWFVAVGMIACIVEECSYITFNIPRYYTSPDALLSVLAICALQYLLSALPGRNITLYCGNGLLALLLLTQSCTTIDPVSTSMYKTMDTGKSVITTTPQHATLVVEPYFAAEAEYNRQVMYFCRTLNKAYAAIDAADNGFAHTKILCSNEYVGRTDALFSLYEIWGYGYAYVDPPMYGHWDREGGYRYLSYEPPEHSIDPVYVGAGTDLTDILNSSEHVYYIEMPWWDTVIGPLQERYPSTKPFDTIEYHGWVLNIYQIK